MQWPRMPPDPLGKVACNGTTFARLGTSGICRGTLLRSCRVVWIPSARRQTPRRIVDGGCVKETLGPSPTRAGDRRGRGCLGGWRKLCLGCGGGEVGAVSLAGAQLADKPAAPHLFVGPCRRPGGRGLGATWPSPAHRVRVLYGPGHDVRDAQRLVVKARAAVYAGAVRPSSSSGRSLWMRSYLMRVPLMVTKRAAVDFAASRGICLGPESYRRCPGGR